MELTWLADTPQSRRRSRALRACSDCQRRKKRCRHLPAACVSKNSRSLRTSNRVDDDVQEESGNPQPFHSRVVSQDRPGPTLSQSISPDDPGSTRFVGDLNPEALLLEKLDQASEKSRRDQIGLWVTSLDTQREDNGTHSPAANQPPLPEENRGPSIAVRSISDSLHQIYISAVKSCQTLPLSTREHLISIYFSKIDHILPLLEKESFLQAHSDGTASVFLVRAVCLVAAKDRTAGPYLCLTDGGPVVTSRQFCSEIYNGLVAAMNAGLETDRISRIRILALMSLHCEGYEGAESASMHLCQAIHQAQTAGLHLNNRPGRTAHDPLTRLFWCLWSLDKMHASVGGRPVVLADRDIGIEKPTVKGHSARSAFDVWFSVADILATVISFYRPSAEVGAAWEEGFPTFEDVVGDNVQGNVDSPTLGLLELFYHAVGILSCRSKPSGDPDHSKSLYDRQSLAAVRIYSIVATEFGQDLPPLPVVPYAVSLSMSVSYQQLRRSKIDTYFNRAKASLEACCILLEELGLYWYSAEAMSLLGRKTLQQIEGTRYSGFEKSKSQPGPSSRVARRQSTLGNEVSSLSHGQSAAPLLAECYDGGHMEMDSTSQKDCNPLCGEPLISPPQDTVAQSLECRLPAEDSERNGFEDIDALFGEYLDLSLPTNFWDPIFMRNENASGGLPSR